MDKIYPSHYLITQFLTYWIIVEVAKNASFANLLIHCLCEVCFVHTCQDMRLSAEYGRIAIINSRPVSQVY